MLEYIRKDLVYNGQEDLARMAELLLKMRGKDIPFPCLDQIPSLNVAATEYAKNLTSPEYLSLFMRSFWIEAGKKTGKTFTVTDVPLIREEIEQMITQCRMPIFVPEGVTREDLRKMFPDMASRAIKEGNSIVDVVNNPGWLWVEDSIDAPYPNTTQKKLEEQFERNGRQGQSLKTYIIGSQINKTLVDRYFDENDTWSRLSGSCDRDGIVTARFRKYGSLHDSRALYPNFRAEFLGGRSEEVIRY